MEYLKSLWVLVFALAKVAGVMLGTGCVVFFLVFFPEILWATTFAFLWWIVHQVRTSGDNPPDDFEGNAEEDAPKAVSGVERSVEAPNRVKTQDEAFERFLERLTKPRPDGHP